MVIVPVVYISLLFLWYTTVEALQRISSRLQYNGWQVARNSCSGGGGLNNTISLNDQGLIRFGSNLTCSCNTTVCHVTNMYKFVSFYIKFDFSSNLCLFITFTNTFEYFMLNFRQLKGLNLTGVLPEEFANLTFLREM